MNCASICLPLPADPPGCLDRSFAALVTCRGRQSCDGNSRAGCLQSWPTAIEDAHRTWHSHPAVLGLVWLRRTVHVGFFAEGHEQPASLSSRPNISRSTRAPEDLGRSCDGADSIALPGPYKRPTFLGLDPRGFSCAVELEVGCRRLPRVAAPPLLLGVLTTARPAGLWTLTNAILKDPNSVSTWCTLARRHVLHFRSV